MSHTSSISRIGTDRGNTTDEEKTKDLYELVNVNLPQNRLFKLFLEQNFDFDLIMESLEQEIEDQLPSFMKNRKSVVTEYLYTLLLKRLNVDKDIPLTTILYILKEIFVRLQYESVLLFNYLYNAQMEEKVVINLILSRLNALHKKTREIKPLVYSFVRFYLSSLKRSIERARARDDLSWVTSFFSIKILGMYNISLLDLEDSLSYLEGIPVILNNQKTVGITSSKHLLNLLSNFKQKQHIEYSRILRTQMALKEGYIIKKRVHNDFKFSGSYVAPILNIADTFYWPAKLAPLIAVLGKLMVIV